MATSPLIAAPYPEATNNAIADLLEVPDAVLHMEKYTNLRYATKAALDAAIPVPERGMYVVIGTSAATTYTMYYDGTVWRGLKSETFAQDATFPVAAVAVTTETVLSRITVPARPYARKVHAAGSVYATYTQTGEYVDILIYLGAGAIARGRGAMTLNIGQSIHAISTSAALATDAVGVIELRVAELNTGTVTTSVSNALTTFTATSVPD